VGGIFRNNGRHTATEEAVLMGGGDLFVAMDANARHKIINFPGHNHASLYDVSTMEPLVKKILQHYGIEIKTQTRISSVVKFGRKIQAVVDDNDKIIKGDVFVDATGTFGPMGNCLKYGSGCVMCVMRCPTFGPRVGLTSKADIKEINGQKKDASFGVMSGSCKLNKDSLSQELKEQLERDGVVVISLSQELIADSKLTSKACIQYAMDDFSKNLIMLDTGHAKIMTPYFPLDELRTIPGLEKARYEDPYSGGTGNSMRFFGIAPTNKFLQAEGLDNVFCGGEKSGLVVGHTEAIITGLLAGHNAVRCCLDMKYLEISTELACGDFISFVHEQMKSEQGLKLRYTFSGSYYFQRMEELGLYSTNRAEIAERVSSAGVADIFSRCLV
jgi:hypothetical protein